MHTMQNEMKWIHYRYNLQQNKQNRNNIIPDNLEFNNELINLINDILRSKSCYLGAQIHQLLYAIV